MIPRVSRCRYCGKDIYWIVNEGRRLPIEAGWTPFKRRSDGARAPALFTNEGVKIPCIILPESRAGEADGYAHIYHFCPQRPMPRRQRPLTAREKYRAEP